MSDQDQECPICRSDMGHTVFELSNEDGPIGEGVLRLRCGHAYHGTCIAMAFRAGVQCPMCRDNPDEEEYEPVERNLENAVFSHIENITASMRQTTYVQTHVGQVQAARARYNKERKKLSEYMERLNQQRHRCLAEALKRFREEHRNQFEKARKKVQRTLGDIRQKEWEALDSYYGTTAAKETLALLDRSGVYSLEHQMTFARNAFRKSFWSL